MQGRVLITGATGFVGSFLAEHYARRGWRVHGTFRTPPRDTSWVSDSIALHQVDLFERPLVDRLVEIVRPHVVHHLAAQSSVSIAQRDPMGTLTANATAQYNLLESLAAMGCEARVVVVGSSDEYGFVRPEENPVCETQELRPLNAYALSKVVQDLMGRQYFLTRELPVVRVRPFLQLGPRRPDRFAIGSFARQVAEIGAGMRAPVVEVGNVDLGRDFTDVRDVAEALALAGELGEPGEVYNIASGEERRLREIIQLMLQAAGIEAEIRVSPHRLRPEGEPEHLTGDASRLRARTGWAPTISIERSAGDTLEYWRGMVRALNS